MCIYMYVCVYMYMCIYIYTHLSFFRIWGSNSNQLERIQPSGVLSGMGSVLISHLERTSEG